MGAKVKMISNTANRVDEPDDLSYPYRLDLKLNAPASPSLMYMYLTGGVQVIVVRGMSAEDLDHWLEANRILASWSRLRAYTITGPDGVVVSMKR